jgi:uncharacterized membrane protein HdeD (DUF308 family)
MTEPQTSRPESGGTAGSTAEDAGGRTADAVRDTQPTVPLQAGGPERRAADRGTAGGARAATGSIGGLGAAVAGLAWTAALAAAIGMIAVGVMLLAWPHATLTVVAFLIGAALIVTGLFRLFDGATARGESGGMRAAEIMIGLLAVIAGLYCLKHHDLTVLVVAIVVGVFWIIHGIGDIIVAATAGPVPGRTLTAVGGVFSLAAGLVILFWPGISLILLLTILGAWLLFYGVVLGGLAFGLRHEARKEAGAARGTRAAVA